MSYRTLFFTFFTCTVGYLFSSLEDLNYTQIPSQFGNYKFYHTSSNSSSTVIYPPTNSELQLHLINQYKQHYHSFYISLRDLHRSDYYGFLPTFKAALKKENDSVVFSNTCFEYVRISMVQYRMWSLRLEIEVYNPHSVLCSDSYLIAIMSHFEIVYTFFSGVHTVEFEDLKPNDIADIDMNGVRIFSFKDSAEELVINLVNTAKLFLGGFIDHLEIPLLGNKVPEYLQQANIEFLEDFMQLQLYKRNSSDIQDPKRVIKSGDLIGMRRLDGISTMIMYGTGSRVSHVGLALTIGDDLYILENQSGPHWKKNGIQKTLFTDWIYLAKEASYSVIVIPLKEEVRQQLNETAAYEEFRRLEGLGYGFHNLLFAWLDTVRDNYPPELSGEFVEIGFRILEEIMPKEVKYFIGEALNKRLKTWGLSFDKLTVEAGRMNKTLMEVYTFPEQDSWIYSDGPSFVCSALVAHLYRAAGIFGKVHFQATELTPRDLYSLDIFETSPILPLECLQNDPNLNYCQILGDYQIILDSQYSTRPVFPHMFERCESKPPNYFRTATC